MCHPPSGYFPAVRIVRLWLGILALALPAAAQTTFEVRESSNPPGLITVQTTQVEVGVRHRVRDFPVVAGTHRFGFWTFNGVRQSFPNGQAFVYPEAVVTEAIEAVAHYFPEAQDGDGDRLPDWWEYWMFGTRDRGPQDDHDGDGVRHEEEFQSGYSAAFRDGIPVGGISTRLSAPLRLILRNRLTYSLRSEPLGLVTADGELPPGQSYTTPHLTGDISGYTFVGFEVDGVPIRDVTGYYLNQITVTPTADTRIVARYLPAGVDSDDDQIVDALEFQHFGGLQYSRADNPDQDGLTIGEEISQGLSLLTADTLVNGGISARLSAPLNYDRVRVPYLMESRPLGLLPQVGEMLTSGTARTSPHFGTDLVAGFAFGYWSVNGVRIAAPDGLARRQVQVTVTQPTTLVAHFFDPAADSDADGLQDAWEWTTFGNLANDRTSDPDSDELTIAQEQGQGLSAAHGDMLVSGGLSTRLSAPLNYETGTRKRLVVRSRPLGIAADSDQYLAAGTAVTSSRYDFNTLYSEHQFTHWTRNGERVTDATGHARAQVVLTLSEDTELVAHFTEPGDDRDADGIPDYLELRLAANLAVIGPEADLDGDGFTFNQERGMGYSQLLQDQLRDGGVSTRLSAPATLQFAVPPLELLPARLGAVRGAPAGSLVANLSLSPNAAGRTYQLGLVLGEGDDDNDRFTLANNELRLAATLDAASPRFLAARVRATDDLGVQRFYQVVVEILEVPLITKHPTGLIAISGGSATFQVIATGSAPLKYQWQFNGVDLPGETRSSLELSNITPANGGGYRAVVTNAHGSQESNPAILGIFDPLGPSLLAFWRGEGNALDSVGVRHGTLSNGTTFAPGFVGQAFSFDGIDDAITPLDSITEVVDNFTMEFWVNPDRTRATTSEANSGISGTSSQRYAIFPGHGGNLGAGVGVSVGTNGISVFEHGSNYLPSLLVHNATIAGWTHVAVAYQAKQPRLYVNGVLVRTGLTSSRQSVSPSTGLGGHDYGYFGGLLDEVAVHGRTLAAEEIAAIYALGRTGRGELENPYQIWAAGYGLSGESAAATANPSGDGINNLLKYAFNLNPTTPDLHTLVSGTGTAGLPLITFDDEGAVRFEFLRRKGAVLTYTPQLSGSLEAGTWLPSTAIPTVASVDAEWERVMVVEPLPAEMKLRVFARLLVSQPASP